MSVVIYDVARARFAQAMMNWVLDPMVAVIPMLGYVPSFASHISSSSLQPFRAAPITILNKLVDDGGWWLCSDINFPATPPNTTIDQVVIYRQSDSLLVLNIAFPPRNTDEGIPLILAFGLSRPGLCRL